MQRFYIIADDLTGANDAGVQLAKIGISSTVFLDFKESSLLSTGDVAIIDTDSRAVSEKAAYERVYQAGSIFYKQGFEHVYKKMDSTLRGNVAAELAAVVSVHQPEIVVVAPAYPKMNRQTVNGVQYVNGQPVAETEFGQDPKTPVKDSFIPNLLKKYVDDRVCLIDQAFFNSSLEVLLSYIKEKSLQGRTWFVCDATADRDLEIIAKAFAKINKKTVWAGSAGLIEFLPNALQLNKTKLTNEDIKVTKTLTVSASLSNVTRLQLETVKQMPDCYFIEVNPIDLIKQTYCLEDIVAKLVQHADKNHFVLFVDSTADNRNATKQLEAAQLLSKTQIGEAISKELGVIAQAIIQAFSDIDGLVLTGGDTAKAVCNQLNMNQMQLYTEIEAGLPIGKLCSGADSRRFWTVTKAGGFGNKHSLRNALEYMIRKVD
jgi:uncharacterized protein YgbK (DUF1537 family)